MPAAKRLSEDQTATKVTMNLSADELGLIASLRDSLSLSTNTGTVSQSLKIASLIAKEIKNGKQIAILDENGRPESRILIPGLSKGL